MKVENLVELNKYCKDISTPTASRISSQCSFAKCDIRNREKYLNQIQKEDIQVVVIEEEIHEEKKPEDIITMSTSLWISLSLIVSIIYTFTNIIKSKIGEYGFWTRCLQAPSNLIINVITLLVYPYLMRKRNDDEVGLLENKESNSYSYSCMLKHIFFKTKTNPLLRSDNIDSADSNTILNHTVSNEMEFSYRQALNFVGLIICNIISYWTFIEAFNFAIEIEMNVGILSCLFLIKPALTSILFYFIFNQKLSKYDVLGILIMTVAMILICLKVDVACIFSPGYCELTDEKSTLLSTVITLHHSEFWIRFYSIILMLTTVLLFTIVSILVKDLSSSSDVIFTTNLINIIISCPFTIIFLYQSLFLSMYSLISILIGSLLGLFTLLTSILSVQIVAFGKAGPADAIVQTYTLFHVIADSLIYGRSLTLLQTGSFILCCAAILLILLKSK